MKICLVLPPRLMIKDLVPPDAFPPLGLALIAAVLQKEGYNVQAIDGIAEAPKQVNDLSLDYNSGKLSDGMVMQTLGLTPEEIAQRIAPDTDIIAFSCMFSFNWIADRALIKYLATKFPKAVFIAGGESITGMPELSLKTCPPLQVCVLGEGEDTVIDLVNAIANKTDLRAVQGIAYRSEDGSYIKTDKRARKRTLEEIPFPAWDLFPVAEYHKFTSNQESGELESGLPIIATRGCPYTCTFCTSPDMWGTRYFMRSPEHVIAEIQHLKDKYNVTSIEFYDLTAIIQKRWVMEFSKLLIERNINIKWRIPAGTRSEAIDAEVARALRLSGCFFITYAPESGSERLLKIIHKKVNLQNLLKSMKSSKAEGLKVYINVILGLPDETHADIWKTLLFLIKCSWVGVTNLPLQVFRPYPGSVLFDRVLKEGKVDLATDDFMIESLLSVQTTANTIAFDENMSFYNDNLSKGWYKFYYRMIIFVFYFSGYLFRPMSFIRMFKNISSTNSAQNNFEYTLSYHYNRLRSAFKKKETVTQ